MDLYAAARTSESHKTHDYPNCSMRSNLYHVKASVLKCTVFSTPLRIAKTKLVQPEVSRGQKYVTSIYLKGRWAMKDFLKVHITKVRPSSIQNSSIQSAASYLAQSCFGPLWKQGFILSFSLAQTWKKIKVEGSSSDIVQLNRLERIQCSLNVIWRKNKSFQVLEQPFTGVLRSARNLGTWLSNR